MPQSHWGESEATVTRCLNSTIHPYGLWSMCEYLCPQLPCQMNKGVDLNGEAQWEFGYHFEGSLPEPQMLITHMALLHLFQSDSGVPILIWVILNMYTIFLLRTRLFLNTKCK